MIARYPIAGEANVSLSTKTRNDRVLLLSGETKYNAAVTSRTTATEIFATERFTNRQISSFQELETKVDDNRRYHSLRGLGDRRLLAKLSLPNADLGKHPFFYSETLRPQNRKEYDLCDKACTGVEDHITKGPGARWEKILMIFIECRH